MGDVLVLNDLEVFKAFHLQSKLWIYAPNRELSHSEQVYIQNKLQNFCNTWQSHGTPVQAEFTLIYHALLLVSVDANSEQASGCSIDTLTACIKQVEIELKLSFTNRLNIVTQYQNKLEFFTFSDVLERVKNKTISEEYQIFNNAISRLHELDTWKQPIYKSWISALA